MGKIEKIVFWSLVLDLFGKLRWQAFGFTVC